MSESDLSHLLRILANPADPALRRAYAESLAAGGESSRAGIVDATALALEGEGPSPLPGLLESLSNDHGDWSRLVGARFIGEVATRHSTELIKQALRLARPAVELEASEHERDAFAVGSTFWGGDPDLPPDEPWPTYDSCSRFFDVDTDTIDADSKCQFVGQIDLADLAATVAGHGLPTEGLLSIFAYSEYDELGISEVTLRFFSDSGRLQRRPHPELNEANERRVLQSVNLRQVLSFPEPYDGPWSEELGLDRGASDSDAREHFYETLRESVEVKFGCFGYLLATTGNDPTPSKEWQRFLCVPIDDDEVIWHHVAIKTEDLAAGRFDQWRSVWVDMDG